MENRNEVAREAPSASAPPGLFVADARRSRFTVQAFATGLLAGMGHNPTIGIRAFRCQVSFDPASSRAGGFSLAIQSASLAVEDDISDKDRREIERMMKDEVLETAKYPEIGYEAESIAVTPIDGGLYSATLNGSLNLHGQRRAAPIPARVLNLGQALRASGEFTLKQSDYQIRPVSVAGGALKLRDELKFSFEIIANRQDGP